MPRRGSRVRLDRNIYRDGPTGPYEVRITVGGHPYTARLPPDATLKELRAARARLESTGQTETPKAHRWTLRADAPTYLKLVAHLTSVDDREDHLNAWIARVGDIPRHRVSKADVLSARVQWLRDGRSPKTINHRCDTLRHLFHTLDGRRSPTPCDEVPHLHVHKTPITRVSDATMLAVDAELQRKEQAGELRDAKTRARFRVLVSTGKRHSELMRAQPGDVDLERRVWIPRDGKGGFCPGIYLNDDALPAWELFIASQAWGAFNHGNFSRVLRKCGWPKGVTTYQARHNTWIAASERGADLADIAAGAGHKDLRMTRRTYVPVLNSRMQELGERLNGRFGGWPIAEAPTSVGPDMGAPRKSQKTQRISD